MERTEYPEKGSSQTDVLPFASKQPYQQVEHGQLRKGLIRGGLLVASLLALRCLHACGRQPSRSAFEIINGVKWSPCGDSQGNFQCANISVPLDHHNSSDERTVTIAVTRYLATDKENRQGAIFLNPGGPGGSGTNQVYRRAEFMSKVVKGQYDLVGFDPRGINLTQPRVSCFNSALEEDAFDLATRGFTLNLPANISAPHVMEDLERQITFLSAAGHSLAMKCKERTGDAIAYMGTEAVVRDIEALSKIIEGEYARINFWGFSYGTVIGQYLIKILSPERIGKVIIDGVVNPTVWAGYSLEASDEGLDNIDDVLTSFASSCIKAGKNCTLNASSNKFSSAGDILAKIDATLDALYEQPVPILDLDVPAVATAANLRSLLFGAMYKITAWPTLAEHLQEAFNGNFTGVVNATMSRASASHVGQRDSTRSSTMAIFCADTKAYTNRHPPPSDRQIAERIMKTMQMFSPRMGDGFFLLSLCHQWDKAGLAPRRSRYDGRFDMKDGTLDTPMLILSNTYDPVTSLTSARYANDRLGDNARLIQQPKGWGHCSISQFSYCTARATRRYLLEGVVPSQKHTLCEVDQKPWQPFDESVITFERSESVDDEELRKAWTSLGEDMEWDHFPRMKGII